MASQPEPADFGTFTRQVLPQQIVSRLLDLIRRQHLAPGDRLPSERDLAASMAVSRSSLREALHALSVMGVIEMRHGEGSFISSLEPELLVRHLGFILSLSKAAFDDLFDARLVVEPAMASMAARNIDSDTLARLDALLANAERQLGDPDAFLAADLALHELISRTARNAILAQFMQSISTLGLASRRQTVHVDGMTRNSLADHREIVDALRDRDPEAAGAAMARHLERVRSQTTSGVPVVET